MFYLNILEINLYSKNLGMKEKYLTYL